jgi:hypothetical protein
VAMRRMHLDTTVSRIRIVPLVPTSVSDVSNKPY